PYATLFRSSGLLEQRLVDGLVDRDVLVADGAEPGGRAAADLVDLGVVEDQALELRLADEDVDEVAAVGGDHLAEQSAGVVEHPADRRGVDAGAGHPE